MSFMIYGFNFHRCSLEIQQLEERHCQALEGCKQDESTKRQLNTTTPHLSVQQSVEVDSSQDRLFRSAPKVGCKTIPQYPTRPAKKSSLKNKAKTYDVVTTTSVEKEGVDKKSRLDPVKPRERQHAEESGGRASHQPCHRKPQQTGFTVPTVGTANAGGGMSGEKDSMMRSGSVGNNVSSLNSAMGGIQTSNDVRSKFQRIPTVNSDSTEFTRATPKGFCSPVIPAEASEFDFDWKKVGRRRLHYQKVSDIDNEQGTYTEKKNKMLLEWTKSHDATYPALVKVLRDIENNSTADQIEEWLEKKTDTLS